MRSILRGAFANESLRGALILALLLGLFFATPLARYGEVHYSAADLTQDFSLTKLEPGHVSGNRLMSDSATQMTPWLMFDRAELAAGRVPLWNPWNGAGCPHFANFQSAVFSPFSIPHYLLGTKAALLVSAFLKLWALGLFTFLFLKELGLRQLAALVGATAFMFSGHNVLLLYFPHVGAVVALPAGLFFAEKAFRRFEDGARGVVAPLAGLTLALLAGLLAGNPEPFAFSVVLVAAYVLVRLVGLHRGLRERRREVAILAAKFLAAGVLAAGLAAFQVLPFLEYLRNSRVLEERTNTPTPLEPRFWPLMMFPNALGNPSTSYYLSYTVPPPTFELVNTAYLGGVVILLAGLSVAFARRDRRVAFFAAAAAVWALYAYDLGGAAKWFEKIPLVAMAPMNRSQPVWLFCVSACAALALDHLLRRDLAAAWDKAFAALLASLALLLACLIGVDRLIGEFATYRSPFHERFLAFVPDHVRWTAAVFLVASLAAAALLVTRAKSVRLVAGATILAAVFLQSGWLFRDYNPVSEDRFFFPVTPAIAELQKTVGHERLAILGEDGIPPDSNLAYGLSLVSSYDGMWVRDLDLLHRVLFGNTHNWRPLMRASERGLKLFGVEWVLAKWNWIFVHSGLAHLAREPGQAFVPFEIVPGQEITQTFQCDEVGLRTVAVTLGVRPGARPCTLRFRLEQADGAPVLEKSIASAEIAADVYTNRHIQFPLDLPLQPPGRPVVFDFDALADSAKKTYRIRLDSPDGSPGNAPIAWAASKLSYPEGESRRGGAPLPGELLFDFSTRSDRYELVKQIGDYGLYRFRRSLGRYWTVRGAVNVKTDPEAIAAIQDESFDAQSFVVLSPEHPDPSAAGAAITRRRLVKAKGSVQVYVVLADGTSIVHVEDEATFLANGFKWDQIETIPQEELDRFTIVRGNLGLERASGLRVVAAPGPEIPPRILEETPTRTRLEIDRKDPGYLVISIAHYPGWRARVNGVEKEVLRANFAFSAIELDAGQSVVEFSYEPASLRTGAWISFASLLIGLVALVRGRRSHRARDAALC